MISPHPEWNSLSPKIHSALEKLYSFEHIWIREFVSEGQLSGTFRNDIPVPVIADIIQSHAIGGQNIRRLQTNLTWNATFLDSIFHLLAIPSYKSDL